MKTIQINGWNIYHHDCFNAELKKLVAVVLQKKNADPDGYKNSKEAKLLAAIQKAITEDIPADPTDKKFRQAGTLGPKYKHWFRAKVLSRYRIFFRFDKASKTIIIAWVNDDQTLRTYGDKNDAYKTFAKMLKEGNPPDSWDKLLHNVISQSPAAAKKSK